jgi:hypothetical protein
MIDWAKAINPCEHDLYWKAISWVETGCECCSATRMLVVAFPLGVLLGLFLPRSPWIVVPVIAFVIVSPGLLMLARWLWGDEQGMARHDD